MGESRPYVMSPDQVDFLQKVKEWLKSAPSLYVGGNEYYVASVSFEYAGVRTGRAVAQDDNLWLFELDSN